MINRKNKNSPIVTVVTPCFNDGIFLKETLLSVQAQTYKNIEMIVVDDGSTDNKTKIIIKKLKEEYPKITFYRIKNQGPSAARNYGIKKSIGKYILSLDADDLISKTYIEKAVEILEKHSEVGMVYCNAEFFGEKKGKWDLQPFSVQAFAWDNVIFNAAVYRRKHWEDYGGYDESLVYGSEDYDFWLSIVEKGLMPVRLKEVMFFYRIKAKSRSKSFSTALLDHKVETYAKIFRNHLGFFEKNLQFFYKKRFELQRKVFLKEQKQIWGRQ